MSQPTKQELIREIKESALIPAKYKNVLIESVDLPERVERLERHHGLLMDMTVESLGSPGLVVNTDLAARTACRCYKVDDTLMCFSKGIIGTLSKPQVEAYCPTKEVLKEGGLVERVKKFKEAAKVAKARIADIPKGERLEPWLTAMGEELEKRGIEV